MALERIADNSVAGWQPPEFDGTIGSLMPRFEAYLKVLHPIYRESSGERVLWNDLAKMRGLRFHPELNPDLLPIPMPEQEFVNDLIGPAEGDLDDLTCRELIDALTPLTGAQPCLFEYGVLQTPMDSALYLGLLEDLTYCQRDLGMHYYPERWWPQDQSWCVFTDYDLSYTLFGGSQEMANILCERQLLECLQVNAATRTLYAVDTENLDTCWRQAAEAILSGAMPLWKASTVTGMMRYAGRERPNPLSTELQSFYSAVANYPHDHERDEWDPTMLAAKDKERQEIEDGFRERIFNACRSVLST